MRRFRPLEDLSVADAAFKVYGKTLDELFENAAEALFSVMVDLSGVAPKEVKPLTIRGKGEESLLFDFLSELIFLKDVERMVFSRFKVKIKKLGAQRFMLEAKVFGEKINPKDHRLGVDVKGVTAYRFRIERMKKGFRARMVLDV